MRLREYKQNRSGQVERTILRAVLVLGLAAAGGLWFLTRGAGEGVSLGLTGVAGLAVVGGVNWFGRVRTRQRWEAAWDAYATDETDDDFVEMDEEDAELCLAAGR
jgi:hypothetical protein